jgi:hypothetical protein
MTVLLSCKKLIIMYYLFMLYYVYHFTMSEYQNDEITKNRGEKLLDVTQEYNENERPQDESESVLDEAVDKVKAGTKTVIIKVRILTKTLVLHKTKKRQFRPTYRKQYR